MFNRLYLPLNDSDINGIIHKYPKVKVTFDSTKYETPCTNAIDPSINYHFCGRRDEYNQWMSFSFSRIKIFITNYSVQAPTGEYPPYSWKLFGKKNGNWVLLDTVNESKLDAGYYSIETRRVNEEGPFNEFNITTDHTNYGGGNEFRIYKIDVFGFISNFRCTFHCKRERKLFVYVLVALICSEQKSNKINKMLL